MTVKNKEYLKYLQKVFTKLNLALVEFKYGF